MPRVLAHVNVYPPKHNAGAENTLHALLEELVYQGWEARVIASQHRRAPYTLDGVQVEAIGAERLVGEKYEWADVAITHLHASPAAMTWARRTDTPLVHYVHNHQQLDRFRVARGRCDLAVMNSQWVRDAIAWTGETMVVHPPTRSQEYATDTPASQRFADGAATLVNCTPAKGAHLFWRLAAQRPSRTFLGVLGAYGGQVRSDLPNAVQRANSPDMSDVYAQTRVLLVPSEYESWGKAAVEALSSGIPIVAAPTPGLRESLTSDTHGDCALFVDPADERGWLDALDLLDDSAAWLHWSGLALMRAAELDRLTAIQLASFGDVMADLCFRPAVEGYRHGG